MWSELVYLLTISMSTAVKSSDSHYDRKDNLICPKGEPKQACYRREFEPSSEWKIVKEGQMIPPGLEIRMSVDGSGIREARLTGKSDQTDIVGSEIIPIDGDEIDLDSNLHMEHPLEIPEVGGDGGSSDYRGQAVLSDRQEFRGLREYIISLSEQGELYSENFEKIVESLERLAELSSDYEIGSDVSKGHSLDALLALSGILDDSARKQGSLFSGLGKGEVITIKDMSLRCLSSALRNNDESLAHIAKAVPDHVSFVMNLISQEQDELLLRRRIGLLGALITNDEFEKAIGSKAVTQLLQELGKNSQNELVRQRIGNVLLDLTNKREGQVAGNNKQ